MRRRCILAGAAVLMLGTQASAQLGSRLGDTSQPTGVVTGTRQEIRTSASPSVRTRLFLNQVAQCVVARRPNEVAAYLNAPEDQAATVAAAATRAIDRELEPCMERSMDAVDEAKMDVPSTLLRGAMAEAVIGRMKAPALAAATAARQSYAAPWISKDESRSVVEEMGACLADWHPQEALALVATVPQSPEEGRAMAALSPAFGACLRQGATLRGTRSSLRAAIAVGLYHRLEDQPGGSPDPKAAKKS